MNDKADFKKTIDAYHARQDHFQLLEVPDLQYLMVDGHGDPNTSPAYVEAIAALYPLAYALKFASIRDLARDYVVMPLEGLWWAEDLDSFTVARDKSQWDWTMMIMAPDWIDQQLLDVAVEQLRAKGGVARLDEVRLDRLSEGLCVQTLHIGPYEDEAEVLSRMHNEFIPEHSCTMVGKHHEIYLSDPRKTAPEKLRTILRQPVKNLGTTGSSDAA